MQRIKIVALKVIGEKRISAAVVLNNQLISEDEVISFCDKVKKAELDISPSFFEISFERPNVVDFRLQRDQKKVTKCARYVDN